MTSQLLQPIFDLIFISILTHSCYELGSSSAMFCLAGWAPLKSGQQEALLYSLIALFISLSPALVTLVVPWPPQSLSLYSQNNLGAVMLTISITWLQHSSSFPIIPGIKFKNLAWSTRSCLSGPWPSFEHYMTVQPYWLPLPSTYYLPSFEDEIRGEIN